jgi:hypothetical protein
VKLPASAAQVGDIYLFTWNDHAGWTRGVVPFESCRAEYTAGTLGPAGSWARLTWARSGHSVRGSPVLEAALTQALVQSAGNVG